MNNRKWVWNNDVPNVNILIVVGMEWPISSKANNNDASYPLQNNNIYDKTDHNGNIQ